MAEKPVKDFINIKDAQEMKDHIEFRKANSEETSPQELLELSKSDNTITLCAVASNRSTTEETIQALKATEIPEVIDCLRKRGIV